MYRIIRRKLSSHVVGILLCLVGLVILVAVFWKAWSNVPPSSDVFGAMLAYISNEQMSIVSLVTLKLSYLAIMGVVFLVLGLVIVLLSRQVFFLWGESVWLTCPYCKNHWKTSRAKGWAECPNCRQFVQPQVTKRK